MSGITHPELVSALCKPGDAIVASLTPNMAHNLHMAVGIAGESGSFSNKEAQDRADKQ